MKTDKLPFAKRLQKIYLNIDLSQLNKVDIDQNIATTNTMLTVNELKYTLDSLDKILKQKLFLFRKYQSQDWNPQKQYLFKQLNKKKNFLMTSYHYTLMKQNQKS
jgi:lipopolysaccharide export system permease protein